MTCTKETMPAHQLHRPPLLHPCTCNSVVVCTVPVHPLHPLHILHNTSTSASPPSPCTPATMYWFVRHPLHSCTMCICTVCTFCTMPAHQLHSPSSCTPSHISCKISESELTAAIASSRFESLFQDARIAAADWDVRVLLSRPTHPTGQLAPRRRKSGT